MKIVNNLNQPISIQYLEWESIILALMSNPASISCQISPLLMANNLHKIQELRIQNFKSLQDLVNTTIIQIL